tara:strand:+ start:5968 stop:7329 length:1362 start_codon:yes stop_codon:yes gene_type:complete
MHLLEEINLRIKYIVRSILIIHCICLFGFILGCSVETSNYIEASSSLAMDFTVVPAKTPLPTPTSTPDPEKEAEDDLGISLEPGWELMGELEFGRWGHTATLLQNDALLIVGGRKRLSFRRASVVNGEILPLGSNEWVKTSRFNWERTFHTASLLPDGRVLVAGGTGRAVLKEGEEEPLFRGNKDLNSAEIYDPKSDEWQSVADMNYKRQLGQAITLPDGRVMIIGGRSGVETLSSSEVYNMEDNIWLEAEPMIQQRMSHSAIKLSDNRVLVTGGMSSVTMGDTLGSAEIYDPIENSWTMVASLYRARLGHSSILLPDGRVLVTGGTTTETEDLLGPETTAEIYDPIGDKWSLVSTDLFARKDHSSVFIPEGFRGGKVILIGGADPAGAGVLAVESYDISNNEWSVISTLPEGRNLTTATRLKDGSVMVVGGGQVKGYIAEFPDYTLKFSITN